MLKTLEAQVLNTAPPAQRSAEFAQHDFERLHRFCLLIYAASVAIWLLFNLLVSFKGGQGFTLYSVAFLAVLMLLVVVQGFIRKARHFHRSNLLFVLMMVIGIRLVIEGLEPGWHADWLLIAASTILYSASVLPLSPRSFMGAQLLTWVGLNPFYRTDIDFLGLEGSLILCYALSLIALTFYTFTTLRRAKLRAFLMSRLLLEQAYVDALTRIPNRRSFMASADKQLQASPRRDDHYLAMIDVDNFKQINDQYGHDVGDQVLARVAADIKAIMGDFEYARLGGEEFGVYMAGLRRKDVQALADKLCRRVREQPGPYPVTISIGVALVGPGDSLNQALANADRALYQSKHQGKDRYTFSGTAAPTV